MSLGPKATKAALDDSGKRRLLLSSYLRLYVARELHRTTSL
jgi:hypothetical protein